MKRIERIFEIVKKSGAAGTTAAVAAQLLSIERSNVSRELNELYRQKKIFKSAGRPVIYSCAPLEEKIKKSAKEKVPSQYDFNNFIGASLKPQIDQARAAVIYPPSGLHTLILGQTGVGKTLFAHMMFEYGRKIGRFKKDAPFITFNCADYYNNQQLLISHIFGHVKGAFTGAETSAIGLIESADTGVLFLDEIHRLPPEGQEMIFYFMDTGTFNRLGETKRERKAQVLIIGATTEDPTSVLTATFKRRIPNIIEIPPLSVRPIEEKLEIMKMLLLKEARCIKRPIHMSGDAVKALLGSIGPGNIGQLESNVRMLCAQALLNSSEKKDLRIEYKMLPQKLKSGLLAMSTKRRDMATIAAAIGNEIDVCPERGNGFLQEVESENVLDLYQIVENKAKSLRREAVSDDVIQQVIIADINAYLRDFYVKQKQNVKLSVYDRLLKIIDADMVDFTQQIADLVCKRIPLVSKERFLYAFGLHLSSLFARLREKKKPKAVLTGMADAATLEFSVALEIKAQIEKHYDIVIDASETEYFAMLLQSLREGGGNDKIVIVVAMHGRYTASSLCDVARKLFGATQLKLLAFDMPLECQPSKMLEQIVERLENINCNKGVLLLADMGSLCRFGPLLEEKLSTKVCTLSMVTTPLVLEAMRKADMAGVSLKTVYESLKGFGGYDDSTLLPEQERKGAIITICSSGHGTAEKLKKMIKAILAAEGYADIEILPVGIYDMKENIRKISETYNILLSVGIVDPQIDAPFLPLEVILQGKGESLLSLLPPGGKKQGKKTSDNAVLYQLCLDALHEMLLYLNPDKVIGILLEFVAVLEKRLGHFSNAKKLKIVVHTACAIERAITNNTLKYEQDKNLLPEKNIAAAREAAALFYKALQVNLSEGELCYIAALLEI